MMNNINSLININSERIHAYERSRFTKRLNKEKLTNRMCFLALVVCSFVVAIAFIALTENLKGDDLWTTFESCVVTSYVFFAFARCEHVRILAANEMIKRKHFQKFISILTNINDSEGVNVFSQDDTLCISVNGDISASINLSDEYKWELANDKNNEASLYITDEHSTQDNYVLTIIQKDKKY